MAVRIAGVILPQEKRVEIGLTYIFGIGKSRSQKILAKNKIDGNMKVSTLTENQIVQISQYIKTFLIEGDLKRQISADIKRLKDISSYRGIRHTRRLPVRGQQTKTNARTRRGKKITIAGKKG
jgi:small subunit ribosomal protein S13